MHGDTTQTLLAPWYSGMAQGQALSIFVRLYELTCDRQWRDAADLTFRTLDRATVAGLPFASWVDGEQHLWLEEYPRPDVTSSERVLNGHIFAAWGVYDYWRMTGSEEARQVFDGALTTVRETILTGFRRPNRLSVYSLHHAMPTRSYHRIHIRQLVQLAAMTHEPRFVQAANVLRADQPSPEVAGRAIVRPSTTSVYRFDQATAVLGRSRALHLRNAGWYAVDIRARAVTGELLLRIASGPLRGWWLPEAPGKAWAVTPSDVQSYAPRPVVAVFQPGRTYTGFSYRADGTRARTVTLRLQRTSAAPTTSSAIVEGRPAFWFTTGVFRGTWVSMTGLPFR